MRQKPALVHVSPFAITMESPYLTRSVKKLCLCQWPKGVLIKIQRQTVAKDRWTCAQKLVNQ